MKHLNALSRWTARNPLLAVWLGAVLFLSAMFAAAAWDQHEATAIKRQIAYSRSQ